MIRTGLSAIRRFGALTYRNKVTFFGQRNFDSSKDYYSTLGVSKTSSQAQIKKAYYNLAKRYHPDHAKGADAKFKEINQAYQVLSDQNRRKQYDSSRTFGAFANNFKGKAQQGNTDYNQYQSVYSNLSPEQQEQVRQQAHAWLRRMGLYTLGFFVFWMIFSRRPHTQYMLVENQLVPVQVSLVNPYQNNQQQMGYQQMGYPQMGYQPQPQYGSPYNYNPNPNPNPAPPVANPYMTSPGIKPHYYPQYGQNQYQTGNIQSNYAPNYTIQGPQQ